MTLALSPDLAALTPSERDELLIKQTHVLQELLEQNTLLREAVERFAQNDAHALLRSTYQNEALPLSTRILAAKAAIKFERSTLQAISPDTDPRARVATRLKHARLRLVDAGGRDSEG